MIELSLQSHSFQQGDNAFTLDGPAGLLEATFHRSEGEIAPIIGIVCHPHSLHGGSMQNKVVTTVVRTLRDLGICSVRFNFRGVGNSAGSYAAGFGEAEDLQAVIAWVQANFPEFPIWLAGFSFGSYVSFRVATMYSAIKQLISIAPPVNHYSFADLPLPNCRWIVVQGEADEIVPADEVFYWLEHLPRQPDVIRMPGVGHYFHGHLIELREKLMNLLKNMR